MANKASLTPSAVQLLMQWHTNDPVSQKEVDRNNAVYNQQGNRNPFVDYPIFADCIWGTADCTPLTTENIEFQKIEIFPNPVGDGLTVNLPRSLQQKQLRYEVYNQFGQKLISQPDKHINTVDLIPGFYCLRVLSETNRFTFSFIKK
jgi:hypothetical protein